MACTTQVLTLTELFNLMGANSDLATALKADPGGVASHFGITLTTAQINSIRANLDVTQVATWASQVNSYAAKVESGVGV
ncbi:MAG TPA: hypothetical protein VHI13_08355 [Candidatus Kapabacteria bacterium]|nr:hypothetical protein [Candidatus Kapabacteria bacterium]